MFFYFIAVLTALLGRKSIYTAEEMVCFYNFMNTLMSFIITYQKFNK